MTGTGELFGCHGPKATTCCEESGWQNSGSSYLWMLMLLLKSPPTQDEPLEVIPAPRFHYNNLNMGLLCLVMGPMQVLVRAKSSLSVYYVMGDASGKEFGTGLWN